MDESNRQLRDKLREAVATGGPAAALDVLSGMGFAIEKEPEPGVGMRMRFGAATEDAFSTTMYAPTSERPAGWGPEIPFLPDVGGSLTLFDRPGRGFSVQWFKVPDPSAAMQQILNECLAAGWQRQDASEPAAPSSLPGTQTVVLERDEVQRTLTSVALKEVGMLQLLERHGGERCAVRPTPPGS